MNKKINNNQAGFSYIEIIIIFIVIIIIVATGLLLYKNHHKPTSAKSTITSTSSFNDSSSFKVVVNKILKNNQQYIPLGVTVFGISKIGWQNNITEDIAQIKASATFWHANIVRIQVSPYYLNNNTLGYLAAIKQEVTEAENDGLNVIITAQYENTKTLYPLSAPDKSTVQYWDTLAPIFTNDSRVWFDLFNEPTGNKPYSIWKNGGNVSGVDYVGMQTLVTNIRKVAPNNIIIAEGINDFDKLKGFTNYALSGSNIVYAVHPYFNRNEVPANASPSYWQQNVWAPNWGNYASQYPIIIGEWGEYQNTKPECTPIAPQLVPQFLSYISSLHIGLIGWALIPGVMINGTNLESPNNFSSSQYICSSATNNSQGAGSDMLKYFTSGGKY